MTSKNTFAKFDKFKDEVEELLKKVKKLQVELKDSLQEDKNKKILLKSVAEIQKNITDFKKQFKNQVEDNVQKIIDKAKVATAESTEELHHLKEAISKFIDNKIVSKNK